MHTEGESRKTIDWYNHNATKYAESIARFEIPEFEEFVSMLGANAFVLDAGSAGGREIQRFVQNGIRAMGIDISGGLNHEARRLVPMGEFTQGDFLRMPFAPNMFDGIWCNAGIVHLPSVEAVFQALLQFHRVLKQGTPLMLKVKAQTGQNKFEIINDSVAGHDRLFQFFTKKEIESLLVSAGFEIARCTQYPETLFFPAPLGRSDVEWIAAFARKI